MHIKEMALDRKLSQSFTDTINLMVLIKHLYQSIRDLACDHEVTIISLLV